MGNNRVRLPTMRKLNVHLTSRTLLMFLSYSNRISMTWYSNTLESNIKLKPLICRKWNFKLLYTSKHLFKHDIISIRNKNMWIKNKEISNTLVKSFEHTDTHAHIFISTFFSLSFHKCEGKSKDRARKHVEKKEG